MSTSERLAEVEKSILGTWGEKRRGTDLCVCLCLSTGPRLALATPLSGEICFIYLLLLALYTLYVGTQPVSPWDGGRRYAHCFINHLREFNCYCQSNTAIVVIVKRDMSCLERVNIHSGCAQPIRYRITGLCKCLSGCVLILASGFCCMLLLVWLQLRNWEHWSFVCAQSRVALRTSSHVSVGGCSVSPWIGGVMAGPPVRTRVTR